MKEFSFDLADGRSGKVLITGNQIRRIDREGLRSIIEKSILTGIEWTERRVFV